MATQYGVVIAHVEGMAVERVILGTEADTMIEAQHHVDAWTRRHGHGDLGTDRSGFYAYADRVTGARATMARLQCAHPHDATLEPRAQWRPVATVPGRCCAGQDIGS